MSSLGTCSAPTGAGARPASMMTLLTGVRTSRPSKESIPHGKTMTAQSLDRKSVV